MQSIRNNDTVGIGVAEARTPAPAPAQTPAPQPAAAPAREHVQQRHENCPREKYRSRSDLEKKLESI